MASTVTYAFPVSGTTAPTVAQAAGANSITAQVNFADADTTATVTHNFQLTTAQLNNLWPWVGMYQTAAGTSTATLLIALTNSVSITITKAGVIAGQGGTWTVVVMRPHSIVT